MIRLIKINEDNYLVYDDDYGIIHKQKIEDDFLFIIRVLIEDNKSIIYKEVLDKIKEYCNKNTLIDRFYNDKIPFEVIVNELNRLLEEIDNEKNEELGNQ